MNTLLAFIAAATLSGPPLYPELGPEYDLRLPPECAYYPNSTCIVPVQPREESPVESEQRKYQERQERLRCADHPKAEGCSHG